MHLFDDTTDEIFAYIMLKVAVYSGPVVVIADPQNKIKVARHDTPTAIRYVDQEPELVIGTYNTSSLFNDVAADIDHMRAYREPNYVDH